MILIDSVCNPFVEIHYVTSSKNQHHNISVWLQEYHSLPWVSFNEFATWLYAARLVTIPMTCTCKTNLKTYVCKHSIDLMIYFGYYIISDPTKFQILGKRRGRPKKATSALSR